MSTNGKTKSKRQLAWGFDLNKCIGCQTCSVACKVLWNEGDEGSEHMWWMTVNTQPGRGTPRDWESMGGGYKDGKPVLGQVPTPEEFGGGWDYNYEEGAHRGPAACPYKKVYFNQPRGVSQQCIGCFPRIDLGVAPACVRQCPARAAFLGFPDDG